VLIVFEYFYREPDNAKDLTSLSYKDAALVASRKQWRSSGRFSERRHRHRRPLARISRVAIVEFSFLLAGAHYGRCNWPRSLKNWLHLFRISGLLAIGFCLIPRWRSLQSVGSSPTFAAILLLPWHLSDYRLSRFLLFLVK